MECTGGVSRPVAPLAITKRIAGVVGVDIHHESRVVADTVNDGYTIKSSTLRDSNLTNPCDLATKIDIDFQISNLHIYKTPIIALRPRNVQQ